MIKFSLRLNKLQPESNNYVARVEQLSTWGFEEFMAEVTREGSILKDVETKAVMEEFFKVIIRYIQRGIAFNSEYFSIVPSIKGTFEHAQEPFNPAKHELVINMVPGPALRRAIADMIPERISADLRLPQLITLLDNNTDLLNQTVSPGHIMELTGERIKINDLEDSNQGVFFIKTDDQETFRVPVLKVNTYSSITFKAPVELIAGSYHLEVRSNYGATSKTLRIGRLDEVLEV